MTPKKAISIVGEPQTFSITAREATIVQLVGDFTRWKEKPVCLTKQSGGVWTVALYLPPGTYHYRFLIDGQWRDDPENTLRVPSFYGGESPVHAGRSRRLKTCVRRASPRRDRFSQKVRAGARNGVGVRSCA